MSRTTPQHLEAVIAALEQQRLTLGDEAVDQAIATLRREWSGAAVGDSAAGLSSSAASPATSPAPSFAAPAPADASRVRQVTILFLDVADSTALLQGRRADDAADLLGVPLRRFASVIEAAGGKVLRYTGDGLKAAFGVEQTREDDALRAVSAGLGILAEARGHAQWLLHSHGVERFQVRVGLNTGEVLLGAGVEDDRTAMGHAVHIAARLEQRAAPGQLCIAHSTWSLVRDRFEVREQPPLTVKGSSLPLRSYLVLRPVDGAAAEPRRDEVPLIGRDAELAELIELARRALTEGRVTSALVLAEAGAGKSRLLRELRLSQANERWRIGRLRAQPGDALQPYGLLAELVRQGLRLPPDTPAALLRERLVATLEGLLGTPEGTRTAHLVGQLIGLDFDGSPHLAGIEGRRLRDHGFRALLALVQAMAGQTPLLLLADDLHWADEGSLAFLQRLAGSGLTARVALVAAARPELLERHPEAWSGQHRVSLAALGDDEAQLLARALLRHMADDEMPRALAARAGGNPYHLQELVHKLVDDGVIDTDGLIWRLRQGADAARALPATLVGLLQARLDALPAADRAALQQASIVGPVFWAEALPAEAAARLPELLRRQLVRRRPVSALPGAEEYGFVQTLLHEVTYGTVLRADRLDGHARVARWLANQLQDRGDDFRTTLALHHERAGDSAAALQAYEQAANTAVRRYAHESALAALERTLAQPALTDVVRRFRLTELAWIVATRRSDRAQVDTLLDALEALAEQADDDGLRAEVAANRSLQADGDGQHAAATAHAERALVYARRRLAAGYERGAAIAAALSHGELAWLAVMRGEHDIAARELADGRVWAQRLVDDGRPTYLAQLTFVQVESLLLQERLVDAARLLEAQAPQVESLRNLDATSSLERRAVLSLRLGELARAEALAERMGAEARRLELPRVQSAALELRARVAGLRGDALGHQRLARELHELARGAGSGRYLANAQVHEAEALLALGDAAAAHELLQRALVSLRELGLALDALATHALLAQVTLARGDTAAAARHADEVLSAEQLDEVASDALVRVARVLRALGDAREPALQARLRERCDRLLAQLGGDAERRRLLEALPYWRWVVEDGEVVRAP